MQYYLLYCFSNALSKPGLQPCETLFILAFENIECHTERDNVYITINDM